MTVECKRPREEPPKCANCGGDHPENAPICLKNPNRNKKMDDKVPQLGEAERKLRGRVGDSASTQAPPALSYSEALKSNKETSQGDILKNMAEAMKTIQKALEALLEKTAEPRGTTRTQYD